MQNIENDMDDLFKRASEKYPLNTGQSDWESIEKKLSAVTYSDNSKKTEKQNNSKKLLALLLLICISLVAGFLILNPVHKNYQADMNEQQVNPPGIVSNKPPAKDNVSPNQFSEELKATNREENKNKNSHIQPGNFPAGKNKMHNVVQAKKEDNDIFSRKDAPNGVFGIDQKTNTAIDQRTDSTITGNRLNHPEAEKETSLPTESKNPLDTANTQSQNKNLSSSEKKKKSSNASRAIENGFYVGIVAGPDFSNVKSSAFSNPGFSAGIVAGYHITKVLFIETGVVGNSKYYYSEGEMFNKESTSMPDEMIVNNLESRSKIIEIPIKIGYRFYQKKNTELFVAGGIAAYIMTKEENHYNVTMNGTPEKMEGIYTKNNSKFPAILSISAGLEEKISGILKIRIEPYLKLPLQGIGVGELPVTSAGIQIGLIRDFN